MQRPSGRPSVPVKIKDVRRGSVTTLIERYALLWELIMGAMALLYLVLTVRNDAQPGSVPGVLLLVFAGMFGIEFAVRLWDAESRWHYAKHHWLDIISCVPVVGGLRGVRLVRLLVLGLRIVLDYTTARGRRSAEYVWGTVAFLVLGSAYAFWLAEKPVNGALHNFWDAVWWAGMTMTTGGPSDIGPTTTEGKILAGLLSLLGLGLIGFVSSQLTAIWLRNDADADPVMHELQALRAENAEIRGLLTALGERLPESS
jgi:voltage-gated potassium channel